MSGLFGVLNTGKTTLVAHQSALSTAANNAANANTIGFSRREVQFHSVPVGSGIGVRSFRRQADTFMERRILVERSRVGAEHAQTATMQSVELQFSGGEAGIGATMEAFFNAVGTLSTTPTDVELRRDVLSKAQTMAGTISSTAEKLDTERRQIDTALETAIGRTNQIVSRIAELSGGIARVEGGGGEASDLRDERDRLLGELADRVDITSFEDDDGGLTILLAGGKTLVQGDVPSSLVATSDAALGGLLRVDMVDSSGLVTDLTADLRGGEVGGLLSLRDEFLPDMLDRLDQFAFDLATTVNAVHQAGHGTDGVTGRDFFAPPAAVSGAAENLTLAAGLIDNPAWLAASSTAAEAVGGNDNLLALQALSDARLTGGGTRTFAEEVGALTAHVGRSVQRGRLSLEGALAARDQLASMKDAATGVSVDEELIDITRFERAYQAGTRVIETVSRMFDSLLQL